MRFCKDCGRPLVVRPEEKLGVIFFDMESGKKLRNFGGQVVSEEEVVGKLECSSFWCRLVNSNFLTCHFEYLLLSNGEVLDEYNGD